MAFYVVHKANPFFKNGAIIELFEDGFQECVVDATGRITGNTGLLMPEQEVLPFCVKMLRRGYDDPKLRKKSGKPRNFDADIDYEEYL